MVQLNSILVAHTLEFLRDELWSVVRDNCFGNVEPRDDVGLDKLDHYGGFDLSEGFSFCPFSVIFGYSQDKRFLLWSFGSYFR